MPSLVLCAFTWRACDWYHAILPWIIYDKIEIFTSPDSASSNDALPPPTQLVLPIVKYSLQKRDTNRHIIFYMCVAVAMTK